MDAEFWKFRADVIDAPMVLSAFSRPRPGWGEDSVVIREFEFRDVVQIDSVRMADHDVVLGNGEKPYRKRLGITTDTLNSLSARAISHREITVPQGAVE